MLEIPAGPFQQQPVKTLCAEHYVFGSPLAVLSRLDQMFSDAFSKDHQLIRADPKHSLYLACALMLRGNVQVSDLRRNIERSEHHPLTLSPSAPTPQTIQYTHPDNAHTQLSQIVLPFSTDGKDS